MHVLHVALFFRCVSGSGRPMCVLTALAFCSLDFMRRGALAYVCVNVAPCLLVYIRSFHPCTVTSTRLNSTRYAPNATWRASSGTRCNLISILTNHIASFPLCQAVHANLYLPAQSQDGIAQLSGKLLASSKHSKHINLHKRSHRLNSRSSCREHPPRHRRNNR